jgi:hypothetical protein
VRLSRPSPRSELTVALPNGLVIRGSETEALADLIKRLGC